MIIYSYIILMPMSRPGPSLLAARERIVIYGGGRSWYLSYSLTGENMGDIPTKTIQAPIAEVRPGDIIAGNYRLGRRLDRNGMGVVFEAEDLRLERTVAIA